MASNCNECTTPMSYGHPRLIYYRFSGPSRNKIGLMPDIYSSKMCCNYDLTTSKYHKSVDIMACISKVKTSHYDDVTMSGMASQITSLTIVYSTVYPGADQRKHQSPASLAFVRRIHRGPVNSPHKWPVTRKLFPFDDVIMSLSFSPIQFCSFSYSLLLSLYTYTHI